MLNFLPTPSLEVAFPDVLACVNGFFVAIEVKAQKGRASELQLWHKEQIRKSSGIAIILYPEQWEDFKLLIEDLLKFPNHIETIRTEQKTFDK